MPESERPRSNRENERIVKSYIDLLLSSGELDRNDAVEWISRWWSGDLLLLN